MPSLCLTNSTGIAESLRSNFGEELGSITGYVWKTLLNKAENEAYGKIKMIPKGQRVVASGVLCRWFTVVSGLRLAEQARMLMPPIPQKRVEELAEHVEIWQGKIDDWRLAARSTSLPSYSR